MLPNKVLHHFWFSLALLLSALTVSAQAPIKKIGLADAIAAALRDNTQLKQAGLSTHIAQTQYEQSQAIYLPQISFSFTGLASNNPLNTFGFLLQQKSVTNADFNPDLLNHPPTRTDFTTSIAVQQPIINPDLIYQRKMAASQVSGFTYQQQWTRANIRFEVEKAYHQLQLAYRAQEVMQEALQTTLSIDSLTERQFIQGLVQASDRLSVKVQVAKMQTSLHKAEADIQNVSNYLDLLLGGDGTALYACADSLQFSAESAMLPDTVSSGRADFLATQKAIEASDWQIRSSRMSFLPKLNAFGSYQLNDSHIAGFGAGSYLAGVRLSWDIFKGNTTRKTIARQEIEKNKLELSLSQQKTQSQLALEQAKRSLANTDYEMKQYTQSVAQATEALRILRNRYGQGLAKTTDVMAAATAVSEQELWLAQSVAERAISLAYIQLLTQTTQP